MITEAEFLYFTDVLGVQPFEAGDGVPDVSPAPWTDGTHEVIVCAPALSAPEIALLSKILSSVKLTAYQLLEMGSCSRAQVLELKGRHIISFVDSDETNADLKAPEAVVLGEKTWWRLLPLSSLLTENEALNTERKKQIWTLLQRFAAR